MLHCRLLPRAVSSLALVWRTRKPLRMGLPQGMARGQGPLLRPGCGAPILHPLPMLFWHFGQAPGAHRAPVLRSLVQETALLLLLLVMMLLLKLQMHPVLQLPDKV